MGGYIQTGYIQTIEVLIETLVTIHRCEIEIQIYGSIIITSSRTRIQADTLYIIHARYNEKIESDITPVPRHQGQHLNTVPTQHQPTRCNIKEGKPGYGANYGLIHYPTLNTCKEVIRLMNGFKIDNRDLILILGKNNSQVQQSQPRHYGGSEPDSNSDTLVSNPTSNVQVSQHHYYYYYYYSISD